MLSLCVFAGKPPLYFQHEGHSRTIIGIERYKPSEGKAKRRANSNSTCGNEGYLYNLLLLDPSHKTKDLSAALKSGKGWQVCLPLLSVSVLCLTLLSVSVLSVLLCCSGCFTASAQSAFSMATGRADSGWNYPLQQLRSDLSLDSAVLLCY